MFVCFFTFQATLQTEDKRKKKNCNSGKCSCSLGEVEGDQKILNTPPNQNDEDCDDVAAFALQSC